jgi:hypothetical protein
MSGHRFDALVFPEHAANPVWEIGDSRLSKLFIQRLADRQTVFNWDRGADVPAADLTLPDSAARFRASILLGFIRFSSVVREARRRSDIKNG